MKRLNYSVNHDAYDFEGIRDLKSSTKMAAVLMYSCIKHFTKSKVGYYDLYQRNWAADLGVTEHTIRKALKKLIEFNHIQKIRDYQVKGNVPARYVTRGEKVYHQRRKGIAPEATVNNYVNNYKPQDDDFNQSSLAKLNQPPAIDWKLEQDTVYKKQK